MKAPVIRVSPDHPDPAAIEAAPARLRAGELVAFPTETVYGLGANALDPAAVARVFEAKGRPATNPLIVHVTSAAMARQVAAEWPEVAERLAAAFWPGPLTLVLPKRPEVPDAVTAGLGSVGVRMPAHPVAQALIAAAGVPVAAPSANRYMGVSPTSAEHVARGLGDRVAAILDGGPTTVGLESTVIDLTGPVPTVLRPGGLPIGALREVLPELAVRESQAAEGVPMPSPGLARRHYAPRAAVEIYEGAEAVVSAAQGAGPELGVMAMVAAPTPAPGVHWVVMPDDPQAYGARLYATLHAMDDRGVTRLLVQMPPATEPWTAVRDRLRRAATT